MKIGEKMTKEYMKMALEEAKKAYKKEEVPIGVIIVKDGKVIAKAHNMRERKKQACAHAEILAIQKACKKLKAWRLEDCEMYVTLEPCPMCAGAIMNARIKKLYIGAMEPKFGSVGSKINLLENVTFNHTVEVEKGICEEESVELLQNFFKELRARNKAKSNKG